MEGKNTGTCLRGEKKKADIRGPNNHNQKSRMAQHFRVNLHHISGLADRLPADLGSDEEEEEYANSGAEGVIRPRLPSKEVGEQCEDLAWVPFKLD